jgi:rod shape-determining protein MreC
VYRKQVRRRRAILVLLIVVSLVLLSTEFSEGDTGPLHSIQEGVATIFGPVEEGASRALKPARDLVNWFDETFDARGTNDELQSEVTDLRAKLADAQAKAGDYDQLKGLINLDRSGVLANYTPITARVIARSPTVWYSTVTVDKGSSSGVALNDPVVTGDGLVGRVSAVTHGTAQVRLITDHRSAVSARVLPDGPQGVVEPEAGDPNTLLLDFIDPDQKVEDNAMVVTAGWSNGTISSAYPFDIPIGKVTDASASHGDTYQRIHVEPFVDLRDIEYVQVATNGPHRPGVAK